MQILQKSIVTDLIFLIGFMLQEYKYNTDGLIKESKDGEQDIYDVLSNYIFESTE